MDTLYIYMGEHHCSIPIFIDKIGDTGDISIDFKTDTDYIGYTKYFQSYAYYYNPFLLGKLTDNILVLEDTGIYDSNNDLRCIINVTGTNIKNDKKTAYCIRGMESGSYADRLYSNRLGASKVIILPYNANTEGKLSFLVKWEKNFPPYKEENIDSKHIGLYYATASGVKSTPNKIVNISNTINGKTYDNSIFNDYSITMNFWNIVISYDIKENDGNVPLTGLLAITTSTNDTTECAYLDSNTGAWTRLREDLPYWGYYYFILSPKSGWICARTPVNYIGTSRSINNVKHKYWMVEHIGDNYNSDYSEIHIFIDGCALTGIYAESDNDKKYVIYNTLDSSSYSTEDTNYFEFFIPTMYSVKTVEVVDNASDTYNVPTRYNMLSTYFSDFNNTFVNDLDGIEYTAYIYDKAEYITKINIYLN